MTTQTTAFIQLSEATSGVLALGRKQHQIYELKTDFQGPITEPIFNRDGTFLYSPLREQDKTIIPKQALRRHASIERAGYVISQVIIGHEIKLTPSKPDDPIKRENEIDWGNVASVAGKGLLVAMMGIAMVPLYALAGLVMLLDPTYCIVLAGETSVIEIYRWNSEV